jgi:ATP-dependent HslUV protease ATP-binding subunit HslU
LNDLMFDVPDIIGANAHIIVNKEMVKDKLAGLVKNRDLSQFIL